MSETEAEATEEVKPREEKPPATGGPRPPIHTGETYDFPNQQVVRPDGSGPGTPPEGEGGSGGAQPKRATSSKKKG